MTEEKFCVGEHTRTGVPDMTYKEKAAKKH